MIEPLKSNLLNDCYDKLNEAIAELNALHNSVDAHTEWINEMGLAKDQPCEHEGEEYCAKCGDPVYKPAPAQEKRIDYSNGLDDIREKAIAAYKAELKQKIETLSEYIINKEPSDNAYVVEYRRITLELIDGFLNLVEEE